MGSKELFLWVSTPQAQGALTQPQVMCNGQALELTAVEPGMGTGVAVRLGKAGILAGVGADGKAIRLICRS